MKRFQYTQSPPAVPKTALFTCFCLAVLLAFFSGIKGFSASSVQKQQDVLGQAVNRRITHCYATNGTYPPSLDYIKENYGITYDENRFFVDYRVDGANIYPDVTIITKGD